MTLLITEVSTSVKGMPTERVALDLEVKAIYAARIAAKNANLSVSEWLSKAAWEHAVAESVQHFAEQERLHPDERPWWLVDADNRIDREGEA